jgi:hypothetical protein
MALHCRELKEDVGVVAAAETTEEARAEPKKATGEPRSIMAEHKTETCSREDRSNLQCEAFWIATRTVPFTTDVDPCLLFAVRWSQLTSIDPVAPLDRHTLLNIVLLYEFVDCLCV